jgi:membrane protease YdiL (CAAX protease family)
MFAYTSTFLHSCFDTLFLQLGLVTLVLPFLTDIDSICHHLYLLYIFITGFPVHFWLWKESIVGRVYVGKRSISIRLDVDPTDFADQLCGLGFSRLCQISSLG